MTLQIGDKIKATSPASGGCGMKRKRLKRWVGIYTGRQTGIVAACSQKEAAELVGTSLKEIREHWSEVDVYNHIAVERGFWLTLKSGMGCRDFERVK